MTPPFLVPTTELFRHRGVRRPVTVRGVLAGIELSSSRLTADEVVAELVLEAQGERVMASGTITGRWAGECRRCLGETGGEVRVAFSEVFERYPVEGETYPLGHDDVDLEPALREAVALALPLAPLCDESCAGPAPEVHPVTVATDEDGEAEPPVDPRWSALDALKFD
ncbi:MAG TPA: DUF177 domain-containing protein [Acidimicrobiales bacterium]|jgi:uncharacterized protein|nr:DUF177 domain-containing protein [Acidimicrobiales bacterium]